MSPLQNYIQEVERMLLFQLTLNLKMGKIDVEEAQVIATLYLSLQPTSKEELLQNLIQIGYDHQVIEPVIAKFSKEYDEEFKHNVLSQIHLKLSSGDIVAAVEAGKSEGGTKHV